MERTADFDLDDRKELYIEPVLTTHAPLRDITAFISDCNAISPASRFHIECHEDHGEEIDIHPA